MCMMYVWGHVCYSTRVKIRGQLCGIGSLLLSFRGFSDQTQLTRLAQQVPLSAELS